MDYFETARDLLRRFKKDNYLFGNHVLKDVGSAVPSSRSRAVLVYTEFSGVEVYLNTIRDSVKRAGVSLMAEVRGARPNAPQEDLFRITNALTSVQVP